MAAGVIWRTSNGKKVWGIKWQDPRGRLKRRFNKNWTKAQAQAAFNELQKKLSEGLPVVADMTVKDLFHEWHEHHVKVRCSPAWVLDTESQFRLRIAPMIGHRRIDTIDKRVVNKMIAQMQLVMREKAKDNEYAGHRTINKTLTVLKGMFTFAVGIEQISRNPVLGIAELPEQPQKQRNARSMPAIHDVAIAATRLGDDLDEFQKNQRADWVPTRDYTIIMIAALTGLRQSELFGLTWDKVDGNWLHVTHKLCRVSFTLRETKTRRGRRQVPLVEQARQLLQTWRDLGVHETIVFPNNVGDNFIRASRWEQKVWRRASQLANSSFVFHELRHTFISLCLAAGRDLWEVAIWAGDDPDMVKEVYGHYIPNSLGDTSRLVKIFGVQAEVPTLALPVST